MFRKWIRVCATGVFVLGAAELAMFPAQGLAASSSPTDLKMVGSIEMHGEGSVGAIIAEPASDAIMARQYIGKTVMNLQNKVIGSVRNLVISDQGKVQAAIVDVGNFVGKGKKDVAINFNAIERVRNDKTGGYQLMLDADRIQLAAAPAFTWKVQHVAMMPSSTMVQMPTRTEAMSTSPSSHRSLVPDAEAIVKTAMPM